MEPLCIGCGKEPWELSEYHPENTGENLTPEEYVKLNEGTYNYRNGHFACDRCYIMIGMPTHPNGWVAP